MTTDNNVLLGNLQQHVVLTAMTISTPKLSRQIDGATVEVRNDNDSESLQIPDELRSVPQWKLISPAWSDQFQKLEGHARTILRKAGRSFGAIRGAVLLPWRRAEETFAALHECRINLCGDPARGIRGMADDFLDEWPGHLDQLRMRLHADVFARAVAKLPTKDALRSKFALRVCTIPFGVGSSGVSASVVREWIRRLGSETLSDELLAAMLAAAEEAEAIPQPLDMYGTSELVAETRRQLHAYVAENIEAMAVEPRQRLAVALENLVAACKTQGRHVRQGTLNQVQEAYEYLEGFAFLAEDDLLEKLKAAKQLVDTVSPRSVNADPMLSRRLVAAVAEAATICRDTGQVQQHVERLSTLRPMKIHG